MGTNPNPRIAQSPQLEWQGGVWQFDANATNQSQTTHGRRYATGIRNAMAMAWNPAHQRLYFLSHGRDALWTGETSTSVTAWRATCPADEAYPG